MFDYNMFVLRAKGLYRCHLKVTRASKPLSLTVFNVFDPKKTRARTHIKDTPCNVLHWTDNNTIQH